MKPLVAKLAVALGLTGMLAVPALAAVELGQSATFSVGAIVIDVCQVANAYRPYIKSPYRQFDTRCAALQPTNDTASESVTTVTRGENGEIAALKIEF